MSNKFKNIYLFLFSISVAYFFLFAAFYLACFIDSNSLYKLIISNKTYEALPFSISDFDLKNVSVELMKYISGKLPFLETKVYIEGQLTDFYSIRSKIHMSDVRNLIINFRNAAFISVAICIYSLYRLNSIDEPIKKLKNAYLKTISCAIAIITFITIFAITNFDYFFTRFHEMLFTNDLWLLDPSEDYIICLLPEKIFMIYGARIILAMIIALAVPYLFLQILSKIQLRQEAK